MAAALDYSSARSLRTGAIIHSSTQSTTTRDCFFTQHDSRVVEKAARKRVSDAMCSHWILLYSSFLSGGSLETIPLSLARRVSRVPSDRHLLFQVCSAPATFLAAHNLFPSALGAVSAVHFGRDFEISASSPPVAISDLTRAASHSGEMHSRRSLSTPREVSHSVAHFRWPFFLFHKRECS